MILCSSSKCNKCFQQQNFNLYKISVKNSSWFQWSVPTSYVTLHELLVIWPFHMENINNQFEQCMRLPFSPVREDKLKNLLTSTILCCTLSTRLSVLLLFFANGWTIVLLQKKEIWHKIPMEIISEHFYVSLLEKLNFFFPEF